MQQEQPSKGWEDSNYEVAGAGDVGESVGRKVRCKDSASEGAEMDGVAGWAGDAGTGRECGRLTWSERPLKACYLRDRA